MVTNKGPNAHEIILQHPVFNLMQWLASSPTGDEVARELVLNYFQLLGATQSRLVVTDDSGTAFFVGDFGFEKSFTGSSQSLEFWQNRTDEIVKIQIESSGLGWSESGRFLQARVNDFGSTRGWITIGFTRETDRLQAEQLLQVLKHVVGIYMSTIQVSASKTSKAQPATISKESFTPRQMAILGGMVEGKTNHELASELGFSVSTIRHETMRVYQTLSVSDRREAAREAIERGIF